jgi:hypothetical protein
VHEPSAADDAAQSPSYAWSSDEVASRLNLSVSDGLLLQAQAIDGAAFLALDAADLARLGVSERQSASLLAEVARLKHKILHAPRDFWEYRTAYPLETHLLESLALKSPRGLTAYLFWETQSGVLETVFASATWASAATLRAACFALLWLYLPHLQVAVFLLHTLWRLNPLVVWAYTVHAALHTFRALKQLHLSAVQQGEAAAALRARGVAWPRCKVSAYAAAALPHALADEAVACVKLYCWHRVTYAIAPRWVSTLHLYVNLVTIPAFSGLCLVTEVMWSAISMDQRRTWLQARITSHVLLPLAAWLDDPTLEEVTAMGMRCVADLQFTEAARERSAHEIDAHRTAQAALNMARLRQNVRAARAPLVHLYAAFAAAALVGDWPRAAAIWRQSFGTIDWAALPPAPPAGAHWPPPLQLASDFAHVEVPGEFMCRITLGVMRMPAITPSGVSYEYEAIAAWVQEHHTCPTTRAQLQLADLRPNLALREMIDAWAQGAEQTTSARGRKQAASRAAPASGLGRSRSPPPGRSPSARKTLRKRA